MGRPRIKIGLEPHDKVIQIFGFIGVLFLIGLPAYYYAQLPEIIPRHYDATGKPDGFSGKAIIWTLPLIGVVMYMGMHWLSKLPHLYNYPQKITEENAETLYKSAVRMIRTLNSIISCSFAYLTYATIRTALGTQEGLGRWFTPVLVLSLIITIGYFMLSTFSKKT